MYKHLHIFNSSLYPYLRMCRSLLQLILLTYIYSTIEWCTWVASAHSLLGACSHIGIIHVCTYIINFVKHSYTSTPHAQFLLVLARLTIMILANYGHIIILYIDIWYWCTYMYIYMYMHVYTSQWYATTPHLDCGVQWVCVECRGVCIFNPDSMVV